MKFKFEKELLKINYFKANATIRYNSKPFEITTGYMDFPDGLLKNEKGKWYLKVKLDDQTSQMVHSINKLVTDDILRYWGGDFDHTHVSDCFNYSGTPTPTEMNIRLKYRYKRFETVTTDINGFPASVYQLNRTKRAKITFSLGNAFKEDNSIVLLWTVESIQLQKPVDYVV